MNIRQEVEIAISAFASTQVSPIPVAYEGVPFTKPSDGPYLQVVFLDDNPLNATLDATRVRVYGVFQINIYVPDGQGMGQLDRLSNSICQIFPVYDKARYSTFSVEQPPSASSAMTDTRFRWVAIRVKYRQEF